MFVIFCLIACVHLTSYIASSAYTFESYNKPGYFIRHKDGELRIDRDDDSDLFQLDSGFRLVDGLYSDCSDCISFETMNFDDVYIRHQDYRAKINNHQNNDLYKKDASFKLVDALNNEDGYYSFESYNLPGYYLRHRDYQIWLDVLDSSSSLYKNDASFAFNPILTECTGFQDFAFETGNLFPTQAFITTVDYNNYGETPQTATGLGAQTCTTRTYETTQTTSWDVGMEVTTSANFAVSSVEVSVSASVGGEDSTTEGTTNANCQESTFTSSVCPGRYFCSRTIVLQQLAGTEKEFTATLVCGNARLPYKGQMKISGSFDVQYTDTFVPMNCDYYTDDYNDRSLQPYCDECSSADYCQSCEGDYYLIHNGDRVECISYYGCTYDCQGEADSSVADHNQCNDPDITRSQCQSHLGGN